MCTVDAEQCGGRRHNPYAAESEVDPYFELIVRFAIEFEKVYLRWLYEALEFVEKSELNDEDVKRGSE